MLNNQGNQKSAVTSKGASLSVVVLSSGTSTETARAAQALKNASQDLMAELIVVSQDEDPQLADVVEQNGAKFVSAPAGSTRATMCDLGMRRVSGNIVLVRDDVTIGDGSWINSYRTVVPARKPADPVAPESVVMNSLAAPGRRTLADAPPARVDLDQAANTAPVELVSSF